jgi:hypothetical protein
MNDYSIALFLHIVGSLGFFVALGLEWTSLRHLRQATTAEKVQEWLRVPSEMGRLGMLAMLTLLAAGFYMMATVWGGVAWITVTLGAIVLMFILGMAITGRYMAAIGQLAITERGALSHTLHSSLHDPVLWISMQTRITIALGIVFLMTVKPGLPGSLLTIGIAIVLGLASALPMPRRERVQKGPAD